MTWAIIICFNSTSTNRLPLPEHMLQHGKMSSLALFFGVDCPKGSAKAFSCLIIASKELSVGSRFAIVLTFLGLLFASDTTIDRYCDHGTYRQNV